MAATLDDAVVGRFPDGRLQLSVEKLNNVRRDLRCVLPVLVRSPDVPEFPGHVGGCFLVRREGRLLAITAGHNLRRLALENILVPLTFGHPITWFRWVRGIQPFFADVGDRHDVAVLVADPDTELPADSIPLDLDGGPVIVNYDRLPAGSLLAVRGHPEGAANRIDYESGRIDSESYTMLGTYRGRSDFDPDLHTMDVDLSRYGANHFCGSPILSCDIKDGTWTTALAGMVVRGGPSCLHFLTTSILAAHVEQLLRWLAGPIPKERPIGSP